MRDCRWNVEREHGDWLKPAPHLRDCNHCGPKQNEGSVGKHQVSLLSSCWVFIRRRLPTPTSALSLSEEAATLPLPTVPAESLVHTVLFTSLIYFSPKRWYTIQPALHFPFVT